MSKTHLQITNILKKENGEIKEMVNGIVDTSEARRLCNEAYDLQDAGHDVTIISATVKEVGNG